MWETAVTKYSTTTISSTQHSHPHRPTHFHALYGALALVMGLLCIAVIILISVWRYRREQTVMMAVARRHSGRRIFSTYPQLQPGRGVVLTAATAVTLPPPYCEAIASPPPYSVVDVTQPVPADLQPDVTSVASAAVPSVRQSAGESQNLLSPQT